ncbi:hypothetical protein Y032_0019g3797 [Ancylostoma ceylanicum]|uniref:Uncharacterized protein n=1 Tax=Ancylostoma ceylanicum TaxID=53326 RepID=A0A016V2Z7_9BILA|nr:hypothetical protein Y032_0019g3797 [Ancylostoma ceylanicum]
MWGLFEVLNTNNVSILYRNGIFVGLRWVYYRILPQATAYSYRILTKLWLRYKMDTIFVFSTSNNPRMQSFSQKDSFEDLGSVKVEGCRNIFDALS